MVCQIGSAGQKRDVTKRYTLPSAPLQGCPETGRGLCNGADDDKLNDKTVLSLGQRGGEAPHPYQCHCRSVVKRDAWVQTGNPRKMYYRFGRSSTGHAVYSGERPVPAGVQFEAARGGEVHRVGDG